MTPDRPLRNWQLFACLTVLVLVAAVVRARGLTTSVYGDEAFHFAVADRAGAGAGLTVAPGVPYTRALPFTEAVIFCRAALGDSEWAQRLPAFLASLGCILLTYLLGARWFTPGVGLLAAAILALDVQSVFFGSYARFYSAAQLLSLGTVYAFDRGFADLEDPAGPRWGRALPWAALAGWSLLGALTLQILALSVGLGGIAFLLGRAWMRCREGRRDWTRWPEVWVLGAGLLLAIVGAAVAGSRAISSMSYVPLWNAHQGLALFYYLSHLRSAYAFEVLLAAVGLLFAITWRPRGALLAASFFLPALVLHSLLPQKAPRYIFLILPFLFILSACGYVFLYERVRELGSPGRRRVWSLAAGVLVLALLVLSPSRTGAGPTGRGASWVDWRSAIAKVAGEVRPQDAVVAGVGDDLFSVTQYTGRADAHVCTPEWARNRLKSELLTSQGAGRPYGIPCLSSEADFEALLSRHERAWIFLRTDHLVRRDSKIAPTNVLQEVAHRATHRSEAKDEVTVLLLEGGR